jgi:hypothetical protein
MTAPKRHWFQFHLSTVLLWVIPNAAAVAWIVSWPERLTKDSYHAIICGGILLILVQFGATALSMVVVMRAQRKAAKLRRSGSSPFS